MAATSASGAGRATPPAVSGRRAASRSAPNASSWNGLSWGCRSTGNGFAPRPAPRRRSGSTGWREPAAPTRAPFEGVIEYDDTTFGGRRKGKRGWGATGKIIVFGILQRNGKVKVLPMQARSGRRIVRLVCAHTRPGSLYYTDDWQACASLAVRGEHIVVRKDGGRPKGRGHINGIEGFWSYAKHWLYPYRGVPRKFFHLYLGEICYRFNHRKDELFPLVLQLMKRLDYDETRFFSEWAETDLPFIHSTENACYSSLATCKSI